MRKNSRQNEGRVIEHDAPVEDPSQPGQAPPPVPESVESASPDAPVTDDLAMPTVENDPDFLFRPQPGCSILDVFEVTLMYLLQLTGSSAEVAPGALRGIALSAARTGQLSEQARRHLFPSRAAGAQMPEGQG